MKTLKTTRWGKEYFKKKENLIFQPTSPVRCSCWPLKSNKNNVSRRSQVTRSILNHYTGTSIKAKKRTRKKVNNAIIMWCSIYGWYRMMKFRKLVFFWNNGNEFILFFFCFSIFFLVKENFIMRWRRKVLNNERESSDSAIDGKREMFVMISYYDAMIMNDNDVATDAFDEHKRFFAFVRSGSL